MCKNLMTKSQKTVLHVNSRDVNGKKVKQFAITAPGFEFPDYVYAETREQAIMEWAETIVLVEVTEIEED